jgi:hypothetical protein
MRVNLAMLAVLAGVGVSIAAEAVAESKNLSCITDLSPNEQRLLRDCEPAAVETYYLYGPIGAPPPPPPPPPIPTKNGEGGKGGAQRDKDHDSPAGGGNSGDPNSPAN